MQILDLSKLVMYKFIYEYIDIKYKDNYNLIMTDTDSFIMNIQTNDIFDDMI